MTPSPTSEIIYIAAPFSDPDPRVRGERYEYFLRYAAYLTSKGYMIVSPLEKVPMVMYARELNIDGVGDTWDYWKDYAELLLKQCTSVHALILPGFDREFTKSVGVSAELERAFVLCKPITYIDWSTPITLEKMA